MFVFYCIIIINAIFLQIYGWRTAQAHLVIIKRLCCMFMACCTLFACCLSVCVGGVAIIDMVYHMNTQFTRRKIIILSKSKILILKYLVLIKLHYY